MKKLFVTISVMAMLVLSTNMLFAGCGGPCNKSSKKVGVKTAAPAVKAAQVPYAAPCGMGVEAKANCNKPCNVENCDKAAIEACKKDGKCLTINCDKANGNSDKSIEKCSKSSACNRKLKS